MGSNTRKLCFLAIILLVFNSNSASAARKLCLTVVVGGLSVELVRTPLLDPIGRLIELDEALLENPTGNRADLNKFEMEIILSALARGAYGRSALVRLNARGMELKKQIDLLQAAPQVGHTSEVLATFKGQLANVVGWLERMSESPFTRIGRGAINLPWVVQVDGTFYDLANGPS